MNHFISLQQAAAMTATYRQEREAILQKQFHGTDLLPLSETFERAAIDLVLAQAGCTALRIYYGMTEDLKVHAIVVGVDASGADMLPSSAASRMAGASTDEDDVIIENAIRCPDICPAASPLNS